MTLKDCLPEVTLHCSDEFFCSFETSLGTLFGDREQDFVIGNLTFIEHVDPETVQAAIDQTRSYKLLTDHGDNMRVPRRLKTFGAYQCAGSIEHSIVTLGEGIWPIPVLKVGLGNLQRFSCSVHVGSNLSVGKAYPVWNHVSFVHRGQAEGRP